MSRKQKIIVSITGIVLVSLILIGLTYAYFLTQITGNTNTKSISVSTANLVLEYGENTNVVQGISNAEPGYSVEKIFTATNKGNSTVTYGAALESIVNELTRQEDLVYTLTCTSYLKESFSLSSDGTITGTVDGTCNGVSTETKFPSTSDLSIMVNNTIDTTHTQAYKLTITYKEMGVDQSVDMNKTFSAKVNIVDLNAVARNNPYEDNKNSLAYHIINNAMNKTNGTRLVAVPKTKIAEQSSAFIYNEENSDVQENNYAHTKTYTVDKADMYFTYGNKMNWDDTERYTITNDDNKELTTITLSSGYEILKGKYIVSLIGKTDTTAADAVGVLTVYYVVDATPTSITYLALTKANKGITNNDKYITYGDSYIFDEYTKKFTIYNKNGSKLKSIKYSEGYDNVLVNKYISSLSGTLSSTPVTLNDEDEIYKVMNNSNSLLLKYKSLGDSKQSGAISTEKELSITSDDYGTSYYYRGGVVDNYVNFAGMCWKIVRIEGDGSVKLLLDDQNTTCENSNYSGNWTIGTANFGYSKFDVGELMASDGTTNTSVKYIPDYLSGKTDSENSMATKFSLWQKTLNEKIEENHSKKKLEDYLKAGNWCLNDDGYLQIKTEVKRVYTYTKLSKQEIIDNYVSGNTILYDSYKKLSGNDVDGYQPTLKCGGIIMNIFSDGVTPMYVGTISAEEIVYSGGKFSEKNSTFFIANDKELNFRVLSLGGGNNIAMLFGIYNSIDIVGNVGYTNLWNLRPSIQLKNGITISKGDGTQNNPYEIAS